MRQKLAENFDSFCHYFDLNFSCSSPPNLSNQEPTQFCICGETKKKLQPGDQNIKYRCHKSHPWKTERPITHIIGQPSQRYSGRGGS